MYIRLKLKLILSIMAPEVTQNNSSTGTSNMNHRSWFNIYRENCLLVIFHKNGYSVVSPHAELVRSSILIQTGLQVPDKHIASVITGQEAETVKIKGPHLFNIY